MTTNPTHLYDSSGNLLGVFIPALLWEQLDNSLRQSLEPKVHAQKPLREPLGDWETLKKIWDFPYPVDTDVTCSVCGNSTDDWEQDSPRKFFLKAASIGGLVAFECNQCHARVRKNHFKDGIDTTCTPFTP